MFELDDLAEYAKERAEWSPGEPREPCLQTTPLGYAKDPNHDGCAGGGCGCWCHEPSPRERGMWARIADLVTDHLNHVPVEPVVETPLWEEGPDNE